MRISAAETTIETKDESTRALPRPVKMLLTRAEEEEALKAEADSVGKVEKYPRPLNEHRRGAPNKARERRSHTRRRQNRPAVPSRVLRPDVPQERKGNALAALNKVPGSR
ncbi:MAG: hypothetical protein M3328_12620 [Chloroflexota bacterium]|nr:hypothetical protein [Chloroflexota bacterium]